MKKQNPTKLNKDYVGPKNFFAERPKKASKLLYVLVAGVFSLILVFGTFVAFESYHIAFDMQQIQEDIDGIYTVLEDLDDWKIIE